MKPNLRPGVSRTNQLVVDRDRSIGFMGEDGRVYGTPYLVRDIEHTCRDLILANADSGEDSVGAEVNLSHKAPTLLGMQATITVTVAAVDGRRVRFDVVARDQLEEVATGSHVRFIVNVAKTAERLKSKAAKAASTAS